LQFRGIAGPAILGTELIRTDEGFAASTTMPMLSDLV
jgi:hypothetical protein